MKILMIGVFGFVGIPMAQSFVRAGHTVYGTTRSTDNCPKLSADEIIPIVGEPDSDCWHHLIPTLDVVVYPVQGDSDIPALPRAVLQAVKEAARASRPHHAPKLSFIQSSSTWLHGENRKDIVSDTTPVSDNPPAILSFLNSHEQLIIHDDVLNGIVIRPPIVYGRSGSLLCPLFKSASEGKAIWPGTPGDRLALVHVDDLADLYLRVAERAQILGGKIFGAVNDFIEPVEDILKRLTEVSGAAGYGYREPQNGTEEAMCTTTLIRPYLARALVGWSPRKPGLADGMQVYYPAYLASRK